MSTEQARPARSRPAKPAPHVYSGAMEYAEFSPAHSASGVVLCTWERYPATAQEIVVLPDGCLDLVWRSDGELFVAGPDRGPTVHRSGGSTEFVGVRLRPGTAGTVLGVGADELRDQQIPLSALWGRRAELLADRLAHGGPPAARRALFASAVTERLDTHRLDDHVVAAASALERGTATTADLDGSVGLGTRQLRRRFVQQVGYGPKTYERVVRFRRFLHLVDTTRRHQRSLADLAATVGYADQAHLSRECRSLSGRTPSQLLDDRNVQDERSA